MNETTNAVKTEVNQIVDSAAGAVKQLVTTIDQWPVSVLIVAVLLVTIIVIRGSTKFPSRIAVPAVITIGAGMNAVLGSIKSVPSDQAYPQLVLAFKGVLLGFISCFIYMVVLKRFEKKLPFLSGSFGDTITFTKEDVVTGEIKITPKDPEKPKE